MNKYEEIKNKHQKEVNAFPIQFAFSSSQFENGMKKLGLTVKDTNKIVNIGVGGFIRKTDLASFKEMLTRQYEEHNNLVQEDKTGEGYIKDMFIYELENHEYSYTGQLDAALDALNLKYDTIMKTPALKQGLILAENEILGKTSEVEYE